ncbi:MAG: Gfo/Idh/MocA family protein [Candidatus Hodarchaeota archaeon]
MYNHLNVGVVGAGLAGKGHIRMLKRIKKVKIQTICDVNYDISSKVAREYDIPTYYTDFVSMLNEEELDFITVCTPPETHVPISIEAIKSGVNVLIEKPLTETTKEAQVILDALEYHNNVKVGVVHNLLFSRVVQKIRNMFKNGEIGRLLNLMIIQPGPFNLDPFISNESHWCHKVPGGRICEALPHQIYLAQEFMNKPQVKYVSAKKRSNAPWVSFDEVLINLESDSSFGSIYWSRNAQKREYFIYLIGSEGTIKGDLNYGTVVKTRGKLKPKKSEGLQYTFSDTSQLLSSVINHHGRWLLNKCGIKRAYVYPHEACFRSFIDSIINNHEPYVNAQKGYDCIKIVEEICGYLEKKLLI